MSTQSTAGNERGVREVGAERVLLVMPENGVESREADPMDLAELWNALWRGKWLVMGAGLLLGGLAALYAFTATEWYRAEVLLSPASQRAGQGLSSQLGQLGGLAALAGINIGNANNTAEPLAVLKSREFARSFIEDRKLLTVLLAEKWDAAAGRWKNQDPRRQPDVRDAVKYFDEHVRDVQEDKKTGLVTLSIEWKDSRTAADWANVLADRLNDRIRERALADANANVAFLRQELAATNIVTLQQSIGRLLESELEKVMVARGNKEFAYRVVDRAVAPKWRDRPKRVQVVALGVIGGGVLGALVVLIRHAVRVRRPPGHPQSESS